MAETKNIADMAMELAEEIFPTFYWERITATDQNWKCVKKAHKKTTHPTDAVYRFTHPYKGAQTYIIFDFKSLAEKSIQPGNISHALRNLALSVDCAMVSEGWQNLYQKDSNYDLVGCLFVYNHDGGYKKTLSKQIHSNIETSFPNNWPRLQLGHDIAIADPETIIYLYSMYKDLCHLEFKKKIPSAEHRGFYHPDKRLINQKRAFDNPYQVPLIPEELSSHITIIRYYNSDNQKFDKSEKTKEGYLIYYRDSGDSVDEFIYLIDQLFAYQIIDHANSIMIRLYKPDYNAPINLDKAKEFYSQTSGSSFLSKLMMERLDIIEIGYNDEVKPQYLETDMGMKK